MSSDQAMEPALEKALYDSIFELTKGFKPKGKVYCLVLAYDVEVPLPPLIGFGLESERSKCIKESKDRAAYIIWNPAEFEHFDIEELQINDPETLKLCDDWLKSLKEGVVVDKARKLLIRISMKLNNVKWENYLKATDDFLVFPVDLEGADLEENLGQILSKESFQELRDNRLIP
jgi:hypothetical protein